MNKKFLKTIVVVFLGGLGLFSTEVSADIISFDVSLVDDNNSLTIPDTADKIIVDTDAKVVYQIDDGAVVEDESGDELTAPITIDSEILSDDGQVISGITTVTSDLSEAKAESVEENNDFNLGTIFFGKNVHADANNTHSGSQWDRTIAVKLSSTVYWKQYSNGNALVTRVSGGYSKADSSVSVVSSSVKIGCSGNTVTQIKTIGLGNSSSWSKSNGSHYSFSPAPYTYAVSSVGGATYTATLSRGGSRWTVSYQNIAWQKANRLIN